MPNCRVGDLAVCIRSLDGNEGCLVHVLAECRTPKDWWQCKTLQRVVTADHGTVPAGALIYAADTDLRPLRGEVLPQEQERELELL